MANLVQNFEKLPIDVLFVEDEKLMRDSIAEIMKRRVNKVLVADNGLIGLELFKLHRPQVILTDIRMPVMSGLKMLQEIRKIDENAKVIVISAHSDTEYFQKAINLSVDGFLLKPVNVDIVIKQVIKVTRQIVDKQKAVEFENKLRNMNELIFQNKTRAAYMQSSMAPSWLLSEKKLLFASNYFVDENTPSGDFYNVIPISETRYICYLGHFPQHDTKGTLFLLTIKMTLDTIIKNEFENASPGVIIDRLISVLGEQNIIENMELLICLIDSDFEFVRYAHIGSFNILQFDTLQNEFCQLIRQSSPMNPEETILPKTSLPEFEFSFDDNKLNLLFSHNLRNYKKGEQKLGIDGIKDVIKKIHLPDSFLIPYLFRDYLVKNGYSFPTSDFSFLLFKTNDIIRDDDDRKLFTFKSVLTNTSHIRKECEKFVLQKTGDAELAFKIELVIAELLTNVIVHGLKNKPDTMVVLSLEIKDRVTLNVWDKGIEWMPPDISKENAFTSVEVDATSGRGMPIIITLSNDMDRCRIDRINQTKIYFTLDPEKE